MEIFLLWIGLAIVVAVFAERRHRSGLAWFFLACLISPVIAGLLVLVMAPGDDPDSKTCPACAESVKKQAMVCKHCGHAFDAAEAEREREAGAQDAIVSAESNRTILRVGLAIVALFIVAIFVGNFLKERRDSANRPYIVSDVCQVARRLVIADLESHRARIAETGCANLDIKSTGARSWRVEGRAVVEDAPVTFTAVLGAPGMFSHEWRICDLTYAGAPGLTSRAPKC